jgi:hypothetical protein
VDNNSPVWVLGVSIAGCGVLNVALLFALDLGEWRRRALVCRAAPPPHSAQQPVHTPCMPLRSAAFTQALGALRCWYGGVCVVAAVVLPAGHFSLGVAIWAAVGAVQSLAWPAAVRVFMAWFEGVPDKGALLCAVVRTA